MKNQQVSIFVLIALVSITLFCCEGMATLFHGPKPEEPPVTYTVTFYANGATGTPPATKTITAGTVINLPDKGGLSKGTDIFAGWSESPTGGTIYPALASVTVNGNIDFYAQWLDSTTPPCTVIFNANNATGGSPPTSQTVYKGMGIIIPNQGTLVYSGKRFGGWNTQPNGGGINYTAGTIYTVTGDITLYAKWNSEIQFTVTYHANGATGAVPPTQTVDPGTVITLPDAGSMTYTGKIFAGWNTNAAGTGTAYSAGSSYTVSGNVTLYAQWYIDPTPITVPGANLTAKFAWLQTNAASGGNYIVEADTSGGFGPTTLSYSGKNNISITLRSTGATKTISLSADGSMFTVNSGVTLVLGDITLQGRSDNNGPLIRINTGGTFIMNDGTISGNYNIIDYPDNAIGGGVIVHYGGVFTMNGGMISGNTSSYSSDSGGGGVRVHGGTFTMNDGIISNNEAYNGCGVYVYDGTFNMGGGIISGNTKPSNYAYGSGGGVFVEGGNFTMSDGSISLNIAHSGGGVFVEGGSFTMNGGTISGNSAGIGWGIVGSGGGVQVSRGVFTKNGGTITGFADDTTNGNVVMDGTTIRNNNGHAVYAGISNNDKRMEKTVGPAVNLSYDWTGSSPIWSGDWEF